MGVALGAGIAVSTYSGPAYAASPYAPGATGYDISWPQCGLPYPELAGGRLAIVGVTGGRPFTPNRCLRSEYLWAAAGGERPSLYVNLAYGVSARGPLHCAADNDRCRSYNYGYLAAQYAYTYAYLNSLGRTAYTPAWWLDVETANSWSSDTGLNAAVVRGAIDYLHTMHGALVGVYSTPDEWQEIAGGLSPPGMPNWVPGAEGPNDVLKCLSPIWPGGQVWLIQWLIGDYDQIRAC
jgi:hypothetical protein